MQKIVPSLWFDRNAEEAVAFYIGIFDNSRILNTVRYTEAGPGPAGAVVAIDFEVRGLRLTAINGGPEFHFTPAVSLSVDCADQEEVDRYWFALLDGGAPQQCGWLTDRFGLSWQVVPAILPMLLSRGDEKKSAAMTRAMLKMVKLDAAKLKAAYDAG
jgi:predicted 3-demethylubiquinone-9 3-methyltransferase (glyoxalase superfamily)